MTIDHIIDFDKKNLSSFKIIRAEIQKKKIRGYSIAMVGCLKAFIFPIIYYFNNNSYIWFLLWIPAVTALYLLISCYEKEIKHLTKNYSDKHNVETTKNSHYFSNQTLLSNIKYILFAEFINNMGIKISREEIEKIIEALKYEISATGLDYKSITIITTLFTTLISTALEYFFKGEGNVNNVFIRLSQYSMILFIFSFVIFGIERFIINDFFVSKRNRYQNLIRVLENYRLNIDKDNILPQKCNIY